MGHLLAAVILPVIRVILDRALSIAVLRAIASGARAVFGTPLNVATATLHVVAN